MRILFVHTRLELGGLEKRLLLLSSQLSNLGHEVCVAAGPGPMVAAFEEKRLPVEELSFDRDSFLAKNFIDYVRASRKLISFIEQGNWEIVDAQSRYVLPAAWVASRKTGRPIVFTAHNSFDRYLLMPLPADRIVAVSHAVARTLEHSVAVKRETISVIHYGIEPYESRTFDVSPKPIVLTAARLVPEKGIDTLLRAASFVLRTIAEAEFVIAGEGPMRTQWENLARQLGIEKQVHFVGAQDNMRILYSRAQLYVLPAKAREGFPVSILEAMNAGLPVVATDVGGVREAIEEGVTGFIVPPLDYLQLAERIVRLIGDENLRTMMGQRGRKKVEAEFSVQRMVQQHLTLYESLIKDRHKR